MAKRKATGAGKKGSSKKAKNEKDGRIDQSPELAIAEADIDKMEVQWALPPNGKDDTKRKESNEVTGYAPELYNQPWSAIRPAQKQFRWPFLRTPLFKKANGKAIAEGGYHEISPALRDFFNTIRENALGIGVERTYSRDAFNGAFTIASDAAAVVASRSAANPILVLDTDYRVEV